MVLEVAEVAKMVQKGLEMLEKDGWKASTRDYGSGGGRGRKRRKMGWECIVGRVAFDIYVRARSGELCKGSSADGIRASAARPLPLAETPRSWFVPKVWPPICFR